MGSSNCGPPKKLCKYVRAPTLCARDEFGYTWHTPPFCPVEVFCDGVSAKYVRIEFPGDHRILPLHLLDVSVFRVEPREDVAADYIAYAVVKRSPTLTRPEYKISTDPKDPIFYSTCYSFEEGKKWLPTESVGEAPEWSYNGKCIDCENYRANSARRNSLSTIGKGYNEVGLVGRMSGLHTGGTHTVHSGTVCRRRKSVCKCLRVLPERDDERSWRRRNRLRHELQSPTLRCK